MKHEPIHYNWAEGGHYIIGGIGQYLSHMWLKDCVGHYKCKFTADIHQSPTLLYGNCQLIFIMLWKWSWMWQWSWLWQWGYTGSPFSPPRPQRILQRSIRRGYYLELYFEWNPPCCHLYLSSILFDYAVTMKLAMTMRLYRMPS